MLQHEETLIPLHSCAYHHPIIGEGLTSYTYHVLHVTHFCRRMYFPLGTSRHFQTARSHDVYRVALHAQKLKYYMFYFMALHTVC